MVLAVWTFQASESFIREVAVMRAKMLLASKARMAVIALVAAIGVDPDAFIKLELYPGNARWPFHASQFMMIDDTPANGHFMHSRKRCAAQKRMCIFLIHNSRK